MGISYLFSYCDNHMHEGVKVPFHFRNYEEKVILVVDGPNMLYSISSSGDRCLIRDVLKLEDDLVHIFEEFRRKNVELHIFFDGVSEQVKGHELDRRQRERWNLIRRALESIDAGEYPTRPPNHENDSPKPIDTKPIELKSVFFSALLRYGERFPLSFPQCHDALLMRELGIKDTSKRGEVCHQIIHSHGECDSEVAIYAAGKPNCIGILSKDSDHLLFPLQNVIPPDVIKRKGKRPPELVQVPSYKPNVMWASKGINPQHLPFLAVMCESDYMNIHNQLRRRSPPIALLANRPRYRGTVAMLPRVFPIDIALDFLAERHNQTQEQIFQELFPAGAFDQSVVEQARRVLHMYSPEYRTDHTLLCADLDLPRRSIAAPYWELYYASLRTNFLGMFLQREIYHELFLFDLNCLPHEELERLLLPIISGWMGHLPALPDIRLISYDAQNFQTTRTINDANVRELEYYEPIIDVRQRNYEQNLRLLMQITSSPSEIFMQTIPRKFLINALTLRWMVYHESKFNISAIEFELLVLASVCVNYRISGRLRQAYPPLSRRSLQLCSFFSTAASHVAHLCLMYGVPIEYKSLSVANTFESCLFFTILSKEFQDEWTSSTERVGEIGNKFHLKDFRKRCLNGQQPAETIPHLVRKLSRAILDGGLESRLHQHDNGPYTRECVYRGEVRHPSGQNVRMGDYPSILYRGFNSADIEFPSNFHGFFIHGNPESAPLSQSDFRAAGNRSRPAGGRSEAWASNRQASYSAQPMQGGPSTNPTLTTHGVASGTQVPPGYEWREGREGSSSGTGMDSRGASGSEWRGRGGSGSGWRGGRGGHEHEGDGQVASGSGWRGGRGGRGSGRGDRTGIQSHTHQNQQNQNRTAPNRNAANVQELSQQMQGLRTSE
eukprot:TRINITY_DN235_c0_g1_i2.p1 TRINITY_DN235_c0_g1~~TRINITY_DN235_c0_g1_i2.p1  ORF type:complete len:894 (+),score=130.21 TRINITY_DN235_c0_g1_i2:53-2734(+)